MSMPKDILIKNIKKIKCFIGVDELDMKKPVSSEAGMKPVCTDCV